LAKLGFKVFPCASDGKKPITKHGLKDATTDVDLINRWWDERPRANIGMLTQDLIVIDVDGADNPWPDDEDKARSL